MLGQDTQQSGMFSYLSAEERVPLDHPLRPVRAMVDTALREMSSSFDAMYKKLGAPVDCAGETAANLAAASAVFHPQRAHADGAVGIQPAVPPVHGFEYG